MKQFIRHIILIAVLLVGSFSFAQEVTVAEYFWDTDPGVGNGTTLLAEDGNLDEAIEDLFTNAVSVPAPGLHTFNVRVKGLENTWSNVFSYVINVTSPTLTSRDVKVIQAEYFWDTDPGAGNATTILALDGNLDEAIEDLFTSAVSIPTNGLHTFNIRVKGQDNGWSNIFSYVVNIGAPSLTTRDLKVIQAEYFWDTDPGQGSASPILALDGNLDEAVEDLFEDSVSIPSNGLHTFNIRVKGQDNAWSDVFSYVINVGAPTLNTRDMKVIQAEYFWDADPGQGNGSTILALDGNLDEAVEGLFEDSVSVPANGLHTFNIRVKGQDNTWSNIFSYVVNVGTPTLITRDLKVIQAEYFWDTDPGQGNGSPVIALDGNLNEAVEDLFQNNLSSPSIGAHVFNLRVKGGDDNWSDPFQYVVNVLDSNTYVAIDTAICDGGSYTVPSGDEVYDVAGTYMDTLLNVNGFDSIVTINLTLLPPTTSTQTISACGSYLSPGMNTYTASGTYIDTIPNAAGCDSIITTNLTILQNSTASISVGACDTYTSPSGNYTWTSSGTYVDTIPNAAGCDSIITVALIISSGSVNNQSITVCDSYTWPANGTTYLVSTVDSVTLTNAIGCDSVVILDLTVNNSYSNTTTITTCDSYTWPANGTTYSTSGTYSMSSVTVNGCDSTQTLNLTILNSSSSTQTIVACDDYTWPVNGNMYTTSGVHMATVTNTSGCDSIITLDLTINYSSNSVQNVTACDSYTWSANGQTYTAGGVYTMTIPNAAGCDSVITLNLNLGTNSNTTNTVVACDSYVWSANGTTYTASGFYTENLTTAQGCDSIVNLDLTINSSSSATQIVTACGSYTWPIDGNAYTSSGTYMGTIPNAAGCDSVITLNLTINSNSASSVTITECDSYTWPTNGTTYTTSGTYTETLTNAIGCDSVVTLNLTIGNTYADTANVVVCDSYVWAETGVTYTGSGLYSVTRMTTTGCDSVLNLNLTINSSTTATQTVTACDLYTWPLNGNSYASSGTYLATIPNAAGCDSVVTLDLTISNSTNGTEYVTACDSFTWTATGLTYLVGGTYPTTLTNSAGCDSIVTLFLTLSYSHNSTDVITACDSYTWPVNGLTYTSSGVYSTSTTNAFGCDSSFTLDLTIGTSTSSTQTQASCGSYTWPVNGNVYTSSGSYSHTIPNANGCDSIITLNLTVNDPSSSTVSATSCGSYTWAENGTTYTSSGLYTTTLVNVAGCDSVITLDLTIDNAFVNANTVSACGTYTWSVNSTTYSSSGTYTETFTAANGCDSTYTLNLTILNASSSSQSVTACDSYQWPINGQTYLSSGTYTETITNAAGCDSVVTLNLTINNSSSGSEAISTCGSYTWSANGMTYTSSGSYVATLTNAVGCDSIATLNLTITTAASSSETISACNSYTWSANGSTYTNSGTYTTTLTAQNGCDSTVTLNLTITNLSASIFQTDNVLTASPSGGTYEWINCDTGAPIVGEQGQEFIATVNGNYAAVVSLNGCSDTTDCVTVSTADIDKYFMESISIYPNPNDGQFVIDFGGVKNAVQITIRDLTGRIISDNAYDQAEKVDCFIDEPAGMYFVEIVSGKAKANFKVIHK